MIEVLLIVGYGVGYLPAAAVLGRVGEHDDWRDPYGGGAIMALVWPLFAVLGAVVGVLYGAARLAERLARYLP